VFKIEKKMVLYVVRRELCGISREGQKCAVNGPELLHSENGLSYVCGSSSQDPYVIAFQTSTLLSRNGSSFLARLSRTTCSSPNNAKEVFVRKL
jgi:hypothetical protein